jgi:hypothetical protein
MSIMVRFRRPGQGTAAMVSGANKSRMARVVGGAGFRPSPPPPPRRPNP